MLPLISASNGSIIFFCLVFFSGNLRRAAAATGLPKFSMLWFAPRFMLRDQKRENRGQQNKNQRLHDPHQHFHKVKRNRNQPGKRRHNVRHRFQHRLARINISKKPETERDRAEQNRNDLEPANHEKDKDHDQFQKTRGFAFRSKNVKQESTNAVGLDRPDNPKQKEYRGHGEGHVEICIASTEKRLIDMENARRRIVVAPADCSDSGNEPKPVHEQNENENRREEPKRFFHQIAADNALKKIVKTFHQPFPKVLRTTRNRLDLSRR